MTASNPLPRAAQAALCCAGVVGVLGTWGRAALDGTLVHLFHALHSGVPYTLPGSESLLRTRFTGLFYPVDYLLDVLVVFFWGAVDGSHPAASVAGLYFLGQYLPILVVLYVTYLRRDNGAALGTLTLWAVAFQMCAIGAVGWVWALLFIPKSATTSTTLPQSALQHASLVDRKHVLLLLPALALGYVVPAIAMGVPSPAVVSNDFQQWAVVAWNLFPLLVLGFHKLLVASASISGRRKRSSHTAVYTDGVLRASHLSSLRVTYAVALVVGFAMHVAITAFPVAVKLFPALFRSKYRQELTAASLFIPPFAVEQGDTVGDGVLSFFLWDEMVGYFVLLLFTLLQLRNAISASGISFSWVRMAAIAAVASFLFGPGTTCLMAAWLYDEVLFDFGADSGSIVLSKR